VIAIERLRAILRYEPKTGKLFWLPRGTQPFDGRFANREAFTADNGHGYRCSFVDGRPLKAHRVIFAMMKGYWPVEVDHRNGKRSDNRWQNLREATRQTNSQNKKLRTDNISGVPGVRQRQDTRKWTACIGGKNRRHLGQFETKRQAIAARRKAEREDNYHPNHGRAL